MTDTEGTTTEKTTYEVPTVAKVNEMINNKNKWIKVEDYSLKKIELVNNEKGFGVRY